MSRECVSYKITYSEEGGAPVVHLHGRDTAGKRVNANVLGARPYLFVPEDELQNLEGHPAITEVRPGVRDAKTGRDMVQVFVRLPRDVPILRDLVSTSAESDVPFSKRTRIDHRLSWVQLPDDDLPYLDLKTVVPLSEAPPVVPRVLELDIEVDDSKPGFRIEEGCRNEVLSISVHDTQLDKWGLLYRKKDHARTDEEVRAALPRPEKAPPFTAPVLMDACDSELEILCDLGMLMREMEPDLGVAWNLKGYDAEYLGKRAVSLLSAYDSMPEGWREDLLRVRNEFEEKASRTWGTLAQCDDMEAYRKLWTNQAEHSLEAVAQKHLGYGKVDRMGLGVSALREKDELKFLAYSLWDTILLHRVDENQGLTSLFIDMAMHSGCETDDPSMSSRVVEGILMMVARENGPPTLCLPNKPHEAQRGKKEQGGHVFDPILGMHPGVIEVDNAATYPSAIDSANISPETRVPHAIPGKTYDLAKGSHYLMEPEGLLPKGVRYVNKLRARYKAERKKYPKGSPQYKRWDEAQRALKFSANAFAGIFSEPHFRLMDKALFGDITRLARELLSWNREHIEGPEWVASVLGEGFTARVCQGDTDSCFVQVYRNGELLSGKDILLPLAEKLRTALEASFREFGLRYNITDPKFALELKAIYAKLRTLKKAGSEEAAKKRYFGLQEWADGADLTGAPFDVAVKISGLETKRHNNSPLQQRTQRKAIEFQLNGGGHQVKPYLEETYSKVVRGELDNDLLVPCKTNRDLHAPKGLKDQDGDPVGYDADQPFIRAMRNTDQYLFPCPVGSELKWAMTTGVVWKGRRLPGVREIAIPAMDTLEEWRERGLELTLDREGLWQRCVADVEKVYPEINGNTRRLGEEA